MEVPDSCNDEKKLIINLPTNATGNITLIINNKTYNSTINDGKAIIDLSELPNGTYDYEIIYSGNKIYNLFKNRGSLKIGHIVTIIANDMVTTYGEQSYFTATFYESNGLPLVNKYIAFKINNDEKPIKTDSNGVAKLRIDLSPGEYNITSTNDYTGESVINKLIVKTADPKPITDNQITIPSLDSGSGTIKLPNDASGTITLDIAGKPYYFTVVNGVCNVKLSELDNGVYGYILIYSGDAKYASFTKTGSIKVDKTPETPVDNKTNTTENTQENTTVVDNSKIAASNVNVLYTAGSYYTIKVYGTDGKLADGANVKVSGKISKTLTTTNGVAKFKIDQVPGTYKITISALGKSVTKTLTVKHLVTLKTATLKKSAKKLTLQATLAKVNGKYLKKKTITFKINGKKVATAKTNSKGVAKITIKNPSVIKKLKVGKKVTYQATYLKDTVKKTAKVKK